MCVAKQRHFLRNSHIVNELENRVSRIILHYQTHDFPLMMMNSRMQRLEARTADAHACMHRCVAYTLSSPLFFNQPLPYILASLLSDKNAAVVVVVVVI